MAKIRSWTWEELVVRGTWRGACIRQKLGGITFYPDNFLSLPSSGDGPVAFEEPDPWLARSAPELISGLEAELSIAFALFLLSSSIPGNGNSFESIYFDRSLVGWAGNGEVPSFVEGNGRGDAETGGEFDVCNAG